MKKRKSGLGGGRDGFVVEFLGRVFVVAVAAMSAAFALTACATETPREDFTIVDNAITGYSGAGGNITFPKGITCVGEGAFENCVGLTGVTLPDSVKIISDKAFYSCIDLKSVKMSSKVTIIGNMAFMYCYGLNSVNIPNGVTSIGNYAFHGCDALQSLTVPSGVTRIGNGAFVGWKSNQTICVRGLSSAPPGWHSDWNSGCEAQIIWNA